MLGVSKGANCMRGSQVFVIRMDLTEEGLRMLIVDYFCYSKISPSLYIYI